MKNYFLSVLIIFLLFNICSAQSSKAKFSNGISVTAPDSSAHIKFGFRFQSLFATSGLLNSDESWESSYSVRRARLKFEGWALSPSLSYKVEVGLSNKDLSNAYEPSLVGNAPKAIMDAVVKWQFSKNLQLWVGQTKLPGNRERVVSSQNLQFVDRSMLNSIFNIDREMGLQIRGKYKIGSSILRPMASISMGEGRNVIEKNIGGFHLVGRMEYLPFGSFESKGDYFGADLKREQSPRLAIGASYSVNYGASRQKQSGSFLVTSNGDFLQNDLQTIFVDAMFKYQGFSVMAEFSDKRCINQDHLLVEESIERSVDANGRSYFTGIGYNIQTGYLLPSNFEIATRFTKVTPSWEYSFTGANQYTLGLSKYIHGHSLKVQSDISIIDAYSADANKLQFRLQIEVGI